MTPVRCDFQLGDLFSAFLKARVNPNQGFELVGYLSPLLCDVDSLPQSRASWYRAWWDFVDSSYESILQKLQEMVHPLKGMLTLSVDGGTVRSLSCQAVFVVLHVGQIAVPLPPYLETSRGSSETAQKVLNGIKDNLERLNCTLADVGFIIADRSSTNRSAYRKMCGAVEDLLEDEDDDDDDENFHDIVQTLVWMKDSHFYKNVSKSSVFVECLPHAVHNSMKEFYRSESIVGRYEKALECVQCFGQCFYNALHRRGRFLDFMKKFKQQHAGREKTASEVLQDLLVAGVSRHSDEVKELILAVNPEWAAHDVEYISACVAEQVEREKRAMKSSVANAAPTESPTRYAVAHWGKLTFLASHYLAVEAFLKSEQHLPDSAKKLLVLLREEETKSQLLNLAVITQPAHTFLERVGDSSSPCAHLVESWLQDLFGSLSLSQNETLIPDIKVLEGILRKRTVDSATFASQPWKAAAAFVPVKRVRPDARTMSSILPVHVPVDLWRNFCADQEFSTASDDEKKHPHRYWERQPPSVLRNIALSVLHLPCNVFSADRCVALSNTLFGEKQAETSLEHFKQELVCYGAFKA
eukprot:PhM_4_TR15251/c0_g1_i5/m.8451